MGFPEKRSILILAKGVPFAKKTTPYVGISKQGNKYVAQICHMGKNEIICRVDDVLAAAKAYNERAIELRGEHARINEL